MDAPMKKNEGGLREAIQFWEPRRIWYNAVLFAIVMLWLALTWPHFRPALNWLDFGRMCVLGLLANICYCAGYAAEFFVQAALPSAYWRRIRYGIWILGMLLAIVFTNYWIADEIYPDFARATSAVAMSMSGTGAGSNMNFPPPLAVVGFLAACGGVFVAGPATPGFLGGGEAQVGGAGRGGGAARGGGGSSGGGGGCWAAA